MTWDTNDSTRLFLHVGGETLAVTFGEFISDNEIDAEHRAAIAEALTDDGVYRGGGGAGVEYVLRVVR